jgi:hypothetical protein
MFYLCSVESTDLQTIFGNQGRPDEESTPPKYDNLQSIMLGQKSDCTGYLLFSNMVVDEFTKHDSVPEGYDFIFRQSWGLRITEEILHRVISTLRAESYPPMADYLDAVVKNDNEQLQKYLNDCLAVKEKYPKFSWS